MQVLKTRLFKPVLKPQYVIRERIMEYLDLHVDNSLILVVAAAGYGKSVTMSQWLDHRGYKYGWISLDKDCNDLSVFLDYLVCCIQITYPKSLGDFQDFTKALELPPLGAISDLLINEIINLDEEFVLVLDDYHLIDNPQIHTLLTEILKFPSPSFKLVLLSRKDPPLILSTLRAYDDVSEIRMSELRFSDEEVISMANKVTAEPFSHETASLLVRATEGWIIGIKLAINSISQGQDLKVVLSKMGNKTHTITQFLMEEIMYPQGQKVRDCLYKASVLSRFCEDLLFAVCGDEEIQEDQVNDIGFFTEITRKTLFIISLDSDQIWFRFHHIFGEILHKQLEKQCTPEEISELHAKASRWFEINAYWDEAFQHALQSGNIDLAVNIVEKNKYKFSDSDQFGRLYKWLEMLPAGTIERNLSLLLARAFLYDTVKDFASMRNDLIVAEKLMAKSGDYLKSQKHLLGEFHAVSSNWNLNEGNIEVAYKNSLKAVELLNDGSAYLHDYALAYQMLSLNDLGKSDDAIFILKDRLRKLSPSESASQLRNLIIQSILYACQGNLPELMKATLEHHSISIEKKLWVSLAYSTYYLSETSYQWNNLDKAVDYAKVLGDHYYSGRPSWVVYTLYTKAFALSASGKFEELNNTVSEIREVTGNINKEVFNNVTRAFEAELAIRQHDITKALELAKITNFESFNAVQYFYHPQLTFVKLLMISDEPKKIDEAEKRIDELIGQSRTTYKYNILMQALLLQSLLFRKKEDIESAVEALKEAIILAEPGGFIRIFVDLGEEMKDLLIFHKNNNTDDPFLNRILEAFALEKSERFHEPEQKKIFRNSTLMPINENFSQKEIEILKMVALGLQNKEIADKLFLSPNSVKKYLYDIYQKLEVNSRTLAINKAKQLDLI